MTGCADCSVKAVFGPQADELMRAEPYGYVVHRNWSSAKFDIKAPYWALADDPLKVPGCKMVLIEFLDGSPVAIRMRETDIIPKEI